LWLDNSTVVEAMRDLFCALETQGLDWAGRVLEAWSWRLGSKSGIGNADQVRLHLRNDQIPTRPIDENDPD
jgi:hypothetical protein